MEESDTRTLIYLLSSSNLDVFPDNSRSFFANRFARSLANRVSKSYFVRLRSIGLSSRPREPRKGYLNVNLYEVEQQHSGLEYNRRLGGFRYPPPPEYTSDGEKKPQEYVYKEFNRSPFLPLRFQVLDSLRVLLTDDQDKQVDLRYGPPTVVVLEVVTEEEMTEQRNFTITCSSRQPKTYLGNTLVNFTCPLPEMMDLKNYEVTVLNILYPHYMTEDCVAQMMVENELYEFNLADFATPKHWLDAINGQLVNGGYGKEIKFVPAAGWRQVTPTVGHRIPSARIQRRLLQGGGVQQKEELAVRFNWVFSRAMGEVKSYTSILMLKPGESFFFNTKPDVKKAHATPVSLLECDVVKPCLVGDQVKQVIGLVPVKFFNPKLEETEQDVLYEPSHLHYTDVKEIPFDSISFKFNNLNKQVYDRVFKSPQDEDAIVVTLSFRPKRRL